MTSLPGFIIRQQDILQAFEIYWRMHHDQDPSRFPLDLEPAAWIEHYTVFQDILQP